MKLEVAINLSSELILGYAHLPEALHEVIELCVSTFKGLLLLSFLFSLVFLMATLLSLEFFPLLRIKQTKKLIDLLLVLGVLNEMLCLLVENLILLSGL